LGRHETPITESDIRNFHRLVGQGSSPEIPFNDGNGRTARLLMNLILIRAGYPPIAVRPEDRL